ncbi:MFS transporter [Acidimicrobiaceae bacterium]|jgi:dTMP kinase|nr:MFS transporter [bacterium]MDA9727659.1 MFS transporter [Acidimicrobiaceae bacterium]MDC2988551.1 MFS transporter [Acidimicrobiaceae bacterium]GIR90917.1 MAG: MFS transporter [Actinomycetota bacterium]|tara:strand:- start:411 stop:1742 length:1332 start_codon:yes stop_codon:yes gene_type:complete
MKSIKIFSKSQFSVLWWSGTLSSFGDWATLFASVALASYLGSEGGNSELTAVIPIVARIIPALMSSFAGILADRFNKKNVMIICDLSRMVIVLGLFFTTTLIQLFLINFLSEIFSLIRQPSRESVVPEVVDNEYLVKANSLFTVGTYASLPLASLAFGVISDNSLIEGIVSYGNGWNGSVIFVIDSVTFLISSFLLLYLKTDSPNKNIEKQSNVLGDLKEGLNYFLSVQELRTVTTSISLSLVGAGALFVLGNTYLTESLKFTQSSFGFMIASFGFGIIFTMVILSYFVTSFSRIPFFIGISMVITGLSLLFAFNSSEFSTILFFIFISGIGSGSVYLLTISYLQSTTDKNLRGRVFGNFYTIGRLSILLSLFISGFAANFINQYFEFDGVLFVLRISSGFILLSGLITFVKGYRTIIKDFGFENSNFNKLRLNLDTDEDEPL